MSPLTPIGQANASTRFGNGAMLLKNSQLILKDGLKGAVDNIGQLKDGAFILSAIIQSTGRVSTVAQSAKKTRNTPEGPYRYMEGIKTFFREVLGLTLNFLVLRTFQRLMVDVMRHYFGVRAPLPKAEYKFLQSGLSWLFHRGKTLHLDNLPKQAYPGFFKTLSHLFEYGGKKPYRPVQFDAKVTKAMLDHPGIEYHSLLNRQNYDKMEKPIEGLNKLVGWLTRKDMSTLTKGQKLQTVFDWLPVFVGSIPSVLFAGFWLEWFTQNKAEGVAKKIYAKLNPGATPIPSAQTPVAQTASSSPSLPAPGSLSSVSWPGLSSYAMGQWTQPFVNWSPQGVFTAFHTANPFNHPSA